MFTSPKTRALRDRLHARRRQLLARYQTLLALADEEQSPEIELVDAATEQWDLRLLSRMSDGDARALGQIIEALRRIDADTYGVCVDCGAKIEPGRLAVLPEAAQCFDCAVGADLNAHLRSAKVA